MSASLVGSEMCIRDRHSSSSPDAGGARPARLCPRTRASAWPSSQWPVSYTHLTLPTICSV
eukprot:11474706-Alexandrium_andersonii.AAC.1